MWNLIFTFFQIQNWQTMKTMLRVFFLFYLRRLIAQYLKTRVVFRPTEHGEFREIKRWGKNAPEDKDANDLPKFIQSIYRPRDFQSSLTAEDNLRWDLSISFSSLKKVSNHTLVGLNGPQR